MKPDFEQYREHIEQLVQAALQAADPYQATCRYLSRSANELQVGSHRFDLNDGRVFVVATGKAAVPMAHAAADVLGEFLQQGIAITKKGSDTAALAHLEQMTVYEAAHPVSDASSVEATTAALKLLEQTTAADLVLFLISGGSSALLTKPLIALAKWQQLTHDLLGSGCTINELNCVRKQFDQVKGGGLAQAAAPATHISLILSDVVGNPLDSIGSGPTVPNSESAEEAWRVLARYGLLSDELAAVLADNEAADVPQVDLEYEPLIVGDIRQAAEAAQTAAQTLGFETQLLTWHLEGEAREIGKFAAALAKSAPPYRCLLLGGESTVTIQEAGGYGGRNLETALAAALAIEGQPQTAIASFATDGDDGPTDAAGAIATGDTIAQAQQANLNALDALARHDSGTFFEALDQQTAVPALIKTGPTGTNVNDLVIILRYV